MNKKRWPVLLLVLALLWSFALPAHAADTEATPSEDTGDVSAEVLSQMAAATALEYSAADSLTWAIWDTGEIIASGGASALEGTQASPSDELYGIGSVSKIFTTAAVLQLCEEGRVALDAPVTRYLPDFQMADPRYRGITVRMLLNHSSGLMGSLSLENELLFDDTDSSALDLFLERLKDQRLMADPGAYSVYCNDGFTLAELVVEAVSGQTFMEYVRSHLLVPAALEHVYAPGEALDLPLAAIYSAGDPRPLPQDCLNAVGAGGLYATAEDLASFGGALTKAGLLKQSSLNAMAAPEYSRGIWPEDTLDALAFGLGWDNVEWFPFCQSDITALTKGGDTLYYHAALVVIPQYHMAAAVLSSGGASTYNQLAATQMLLAALDEQGVYVDETLPAPEATVPSPMPAEVAQNAGYYGSTSVQYQVSISPEGTLTLSYLTYPSLPGQTFVYCADGSFRDATGTAQLRFIKESNGETYLYQKALSVVPGLGALPVSNYAAVKMPENQLSDSVQAIWDTVYATSILPVSERYSSQSYLALGSSELQEVPQMVPGYIGGSRIVDETSARYSLQVPGNAGRDGQDWTLTQQGGGTWVQVNEELYMPEDQAPDLFAGGGWSYTTVGEDGYARWYHVGDCAGKSMTVQVPEEAGFWVYDATGAVTASSVLWDDTTVTLPEGGLVVFAGDPGSRFHLRLA